MFPYHRQDHQLISIHKGSSQVSKWHTSKTKALQSHWATMATLVPEVHTMSSSQTAAPPVPYHSHGRATGSELLGSRVLLKGHKSEYLMLRMSAESRQRNAGWLSQCITAWIVCVVQSKGRLSSSPSFLLAYNTIPYARQLETCCRLNAESYTSRKVLP